ncbi:MAG: SDR family oxidoreductase [Chloroflexota bacterium]|nr:SDR family oxidoreductase [Chloroflexota bacterium]
MRLEGKNAIVTGAGSGIGRAIALGFAREGAGVVAADLDRDAADRTAAEIVAAGGRAIAVGVDVAVRASNEALLAAALAEFGRIDILANNAGVSGRAHFLDMTDEEWDRVLDVNLRGQFLCGQVVARQMAADGGGSIINTSSQLAEGAANPNSSHYLASKGGSRMLTRAMAVDLAPHNIRVNALAPGVTVTGLTRERLATDHAWREWALARIPLGRLGEPDDQVGAAIFLASDESRYMTGATLVVDGGYTAR